MPTAQTSQPTVIVIDDDPGMRESISGLIRSVGFQVKTLASVDEFRQYGSPQGPSCLVLDVRLPGQSGLELQRELAASHTQLPIVFITGHGDIPMTVQAMKGGAIEFLTKPFRDQDLLDAVQIGLARDRARLDDEKSMTGLRARFETLTAREREVMAWVVAGRLNKQIAGEMGISEITVKVHRGQVMRKMKASSLPDLARMADKLKLASARLRPGVARPPPTRSRRVGLVRRQEARDSSWQRALRWRQLSQRWLAGARCQTPHEPITAASAPLLVKATATRGLAEVHRPCADCCGDGRSTNPTA